MEHIKLKAQKFILRAELVRKEMQEKLKVQGTAVDANELAALRLGLEEEKQRRQSLEVINAALRSDVVQLRQQLQAAELRAAEAERQNEALHLTTRAVAAGGGARGHSPGVHAASGGVDHAPPPAYSHSKAECRDTGMITT